MAVNPLDLQTNFMQINSISKKEILSKEQEVLKQEYVTDLLKKESEKNVENVRELKDPEGLEKTNNRNRKNNNSGQNGNNSSSDDENKEEVFEDGKNKNVEIKQDGVGSRIDTVG